MSSTITTFDKKLDKKISAFTFLSEAKFNPHLIAEVVRCELSNLRGGNAHTKTRAEVRGGGKKPWRQKGTGRARHGSTRSPIWVGGGVTFGPRNDRNWRKGINKSARISALKGILKDRLEAENIYELGARFNYPKTKDFMGVLENFTKKTKAKAKEVLVIYTSEDKLKLMGVVNTEVKMVNVNHLRIHKLSQAHFYVFTPKARAALEARFNVTNN